MDTVRAVVDDDVVDVGDYSNLNGEQIVFLLKGMRANIGVLLTVVTGARLCHLVNHVLRLYDVERGRTVVVTLYDDVRLNTAVLGAETLPPGLWAVNRGGFIQIATGGGDLTYDEVTGRFATKSR